MKDQPRSTSMAHGSFNRFLVALSAALLLGSVTTEAFGVTVETRKQTPTALFFKKEAIVGQPAIKTITPTDEQHVLQQEEEIKELLHDEEQYRRRSQLKRDLAVAAIENYDMEAYNQGMTTVAEDIMKELETINPWERPAHHPELNARWSFVFTGVPTIGMRLITLLSRISVGISAIDFHDVFLEVSKQQSQVKAVVSFDVFGVPVELNVYTNLRPNATDSQLPPTDTAQPGQGKGTFLIESFDRLVLAGIELPAPETWKKSRDLEITYLDEDMMIARTAGGEPHLLLRHSPCSTDAPDIEECDIDTEVTEYFEEAREKYGSKLSRSLVDRAYDGDSNKRELDVENIVRIIGAILNRKDAH